MCFFLASKLNADVDIILEFSSLISVFLNEVPLPLFDDDPSFAVCYIQTVC